MSGFAVLWRPDGAPVEELEARRIGAPLGISGSEGAVVLSPGVGMACETYDVALPEPTGPVRGARGELLVFDGRLDEREALAAWAGVPPLTGDAALLLAVWAARGERCLERLSGDFAFVLHEPCEERLVLARDAIGIIPLHYALLPRAVLAASEAKALLAHPEMEARPELAHLAEYLLGTPRSDDAGLTCFQGVEAVPPGSCAIVTREGARRSRFWSFPAEPVRLASPDEYRDAFRERFQTAVARRIRGARPVAVSVSGGVDSSAVFSMAHWLRAGRPGLPPVEGLTEAHPGDPLADELAYVEALESRFELTVHRRPGGGVGTLESWSRQVWHVELPQLHPFAEALEDRFRFARSLGSRVLLGGEWGDAVLFDQSYLADLLRSGRLPTLRRHLAAIPAWFEDADPRPFRRQFLRDLAKSALPGRAMDVARRWRRERGGSLFRDAPAFRGLHARAEALPRAGTAHARSMQAVLRSRRAAAELGALGKYANLAGLRFALPYVDRELVAFLAAIPGDAAAPEGVPKGLLREAMRGIMPTSIVDRRSKADFTHLARAGLHGYFSSVSGYLRTHTASLDLGVVDAAGRSRLLQDWEAQGSDPGSYRFWEVLQVLGLELWLQAFFAGPRPPRPLE